MIWQPNPGHAFAQKLKGDSATAKKSTVAQKKLAKINTKGMKPMASFFGKKN